MGLVPQDILGDTVEAATPDSARAQAAVPSNAAASLPSLRAALDFLAQRPSLRDFVGFVLRLIAREFDSPIVEFWRHRESRFAWIELVCAEGRVGAPEDFQHIRVGGYDVPLAMTDGESLDDRRQPFELRRSDPDRFGLAHYWDWYAIHYAVDRLVNVPVNVGDQTVAAIVIFKRDDGTPRDKQIAAAESFAQLFGMALQINALAESETQIAILSERENAAQERATELAAANDALRRSASSLVGEDSLPTFLGVLLTEVCSVCDAIGAAIFGYESVTDTLSMVAFVSRGAIIDNAVDERMRIWRRPIPAGISGCGKLLVCRGDVIWVDNEHPPPSHWPASVPWHRAMGHRAVASLPLFAGGTLIGLIGLFFPDLRRPSDAVLAQTQALAEHAALALRLGELSERSRRSAVLEERNRMAGEIHDSLAQSFTAIAMQSAALEVSFDPGTREGKTLKLIEQTARLGLGIC